MVSISKSQSSVADKLPAVKRRRTLMTRTMKRRTSSTSINNNSRNPRLHLYNQRSSKKTLRKRDYVNRKMLRLKLKRDKRRQLRELRKSPLK